MLTYAILHILGAALGMACARLYLISRNKLSTYSITVCLLFAVLFGPGFLLTATADLREEMQESRP